MSIIQPWNEAGRAVSISTPLAFEVSAADSGCLNYSPFSRGCLDFCRFLITGAYGDVPLIIPTLFSGLPGLQQFILNSAVFP